MIAIMSGMKKVLSIVVLVGILAAGLALAFPSGIAAAASLAQNPQPQGVKTPDSARLEKAYQNEQKALKVQAERLTRLDERVVKFGDRIARLKGEGKDVNALEEALADFKTKIGEAHSQHDEAARILSTHAGFDASGKVTDAKEAAETVKEAGKLLKDAHRDIRSALGEILRAIRQFIRKL